MNSKVDWRRRTALECGRLVKDHLGKLNKSSLRAIIESMTQYLSDDDVGEAVKYEDMKRQMRNRDQRIQHLEDKMGRALDDNVWNVYLKASKAENEKLKAKNQELMGGVNDPIASKEKIKLAYIHSGNGTIRIYDTVTGRDVDGITDAEVISGIMRATQLKVTSYIYDDRGKKYTSMRKDDLQE